MQGLKQREKKKYEWEKLQGEAKRRELQSSKHLASLGGWLALAICKPGIECIRKYPVLVLYFKTQSKEIRDLSINFSHFVTKEYAQVKYIIQKECLKVVFIKY